MVAASSLEYSRRLPCPALHTVPCSSRTLCLRLVRSEVSVAVSGLFLVSRPGHYKACRPTWYPHTVSAVRPQNNPTDCCLPQCPHAALGLDSGVQRQGALSRAIVLAQVSEPHPASRSGLRGLYSPALLCSWGPPGQEEIFRGP